MGYSTNYGGCLFFRGVDSNTTACLATAQHETSKWGWDLEVQYEDGKTWIQWSGREKSNDLEGEINEFIMVMRKHFPTFYLTGDMLCQGEDITDRGRIVMVGTVAIRKQLE